MLQVGRRLCRRIACCAIGALVLLAPLAASAVPFGDNGIAIPPIYIPGATSTPTALVRQADGKLIVAGTTAGPVSETMFAARFTTAGTLDTSYGAGGVAYVPIPSFATGLSAQAATLDGQGNLVMSGALSDGSYYGTTAVARLTPSGTPDETYGPGGVREIVFADPDPGSRASSVAVDSAGRTVVLASPVNPTTSQGIGVARLTPQGLLDTSFNGTGLSKFGTYGTQAGSIAVDAANNVFITGLDDPSSSTPVFVVKLTAAGQFDPSFNGNGVAHLALGNYNVRFPAVIDANGRIVVASESYVNAHQAFQVMRLTTSGAVDPSFGVSGISNVALDGQISDALLTSMSLDSLGRIVLAAHGTNAQTNGDGVFAARLLDTGAIDTSFNGVGIQSIPISPYTGWVLASLVIDSGDSIVLAGAQGSPTSGSIDVIVGRLTSAGASDSTFNGTGLVTQNCGVKQLTLTSLARQRDGKLVLSGYTGESGPVPNEIIVARLTTSGALDPTFNGAGFKVVLDAPGIEHNRASTVEIDGSDNIVLGGADETGDFVVARLTPSGGPDATFNGSGFSRVSGYVPNWTLASGVVIDAHGNIVLAGKAATAGVGGGNSFYVIRFTPSGTLDPTFGKGGVAQVPVSNPYGVSDLVGVAIDSVGRIVLGGTTEDAFSQPNGIVMRLTNAGVLDATFAGTGSQLIPPPPGSFSAESSALAVDASDRIVLAGNDRGWPVVTRLRSTGALDPAFNGSGMVSAHAFGQ